MNPEDIATTPRQDSLKVFTPTKNEKKIDQKKKVHQKNVERASQLDSTAINEAGYKPETTTPKQVKFTGANEMSEGLDSVSEIIGVMLSDQAIEQATKGLNTTKSAERIISVLRNKKKLTKPEVKGKLRAGAEKILNKKLHTRVMRFIYWFKSNYNKLVGKIDKLPALESRVIKEAFSGLLGRDLYNAFETVLKSKEPLTYDQYATLIQKVNYRDFKTRVQHHSSEIGKDIFKAINKAKDIFGEKISAKDFQNYVVQALEYCEHENLGVKHFDKGDLGPFACTIDPEKNICVIHLKKKGSLKEELGKGGFKAVHNALMVSLDSGAVRLVADAVVRGSYDPNFEETSQEVETMRELQECEYTVDPPILTVDYEKKEIFGLWEKKRDLKPFHDELGITQGDSIAEILEKCKKGITDVDKKLTPLAKKLNEVLDKIIDSKKEECIKCLRNSEFSKLKEKKCGFEDIDFDKKSLLEEKKQIINSFISSVEQLEAKTEKKKLLLFPVFETDLEKLAFEKTPKNRDQNKIEGLLLMAAKGLKFTHDKGYAHCDIKLENVFIEKDEDGGKARLGDFGTATKEKTSDKGTQIYLPPEKMASKSGDIWSFGLMMFLAFYGNHELDFPGGIADFVDMDDNVRMKLLDKYKKEAKYPQRIEIIKACLKNNSEHRITADDLVKRLEELNKLD